MITQLFDKNVFKVISLFSLSPGSRFRRNEIQHRVKLNNIPLDRALTILTDAGILHRKNNLYELHFHNPYTTKIIEIALYQYRECKEIPFDVYLLLQDAESALSLSKTKITDGYLFGSYAKLIYTSDSDVDLAVIVPGSLDDKTSDRRVFDRIAEKLEQKYNKRVEMHIFEKESFYRNKRDPLVADILRNGIRFAGKEEVTRNQEFRETAYEMNVSGAV